MPKTAPQKWIVVIRAGPNQRNYPKPALMKLAPNRTTQRQGFPTTDGSTTETAHKRKYTRAAWCLVKGSLNNQFQYEQT